MVGPVSGPIGGADIVRLVPERPKDQNTAARTPQEETASEAAATEEARGNRSAVVQGVDDLLNELRTAADRSQSDLRIEKDQTTGDFIYKSVDRETGEVVREWPQQEIQRALQQLSLLRGVILNQTV